jgi:hypothetical protein
VILVIVINTVAVFVDEMTMDNTAELERRVEEPAVEIRGLLDQLRRALPSPRDAEPDPEGSKLRDPTPPAPRGNSGPADPSNLT